MDKFQRFYNENFKRLVNVAAMYLNDLDLAKDVVQDVFLEMYKKQDTINTFNGYFFKCLFNARNSMSRKKEGSSMDRYLSIKAKNDDLQQPLFVVETTQYLSEAFTHLNEIERIILAARLQEIPMDDILVELKIKKTTGYKVLESAREKARLFIEMRMKQDQEQDRKEILRYKEMDDLGTDYDF